MSIGKTLVTVILAAHLLSCLWFWVHCYDAAKAVSYPWLGLALVVQLVLGQAWLRCNIMVDASVAKHLLFETQVGK